MAQIQLQTLPGSLATFSCHNNMGKICFYTLQMYDLVIFKIPNYIRCLIALVVVKAAWGPFKMMARVGLQEA